MTQIIVLSRDKLESKQYVPGYTYAMIMIADPKDDFVIDSQHINMPWIIGLCGVKFHDLDEDHGEYRAMTARDADAIVDFVKHLWGHVDYLIAQCEAGISRSAGVAAAISKWATGDDNIYFNSGRYIPNRRCYRMVLERLMNDE